VVFLYSSMQNWKFHLQSPPPTPVQGVRGRSRGGRASTLLPGLAGGTDAMYMLPEKSEENSWYTTAFLCFTQTVQAL